MRGQLGFEVYSMKLIGNLAYLASGSTLFLVDVTNPAAPTLRTTFKLPNIYTVTIIDTLEVSNDQVYLAFNGDVWVVQQVR